MSTIPFLCCFLVLLPLSISLGRCSNISFSLCWFNKNDVSERENVNIWLNKTLLDSIGKSGKATSLTVYPGVRNTLSLQYGDSAHAWTFTLNQRTKHIKINGLVRPKLHPSNETQSFLQTLLPWEVFACENSTLFFHQEHDFFLAIGYSTRLPVKLESRSSSMLLLSWGGPLSPSSPAEAHFVGLYGSELDSISPVSLETTADTHHRFTGLDSCTVYITCVEISGTHSLTCLSTITDPDKPRDLEVWWLNSSSLALSWDCPESRRYSLFLLTVFHYNGASHTPGTPLTPQTQPEEARHWVKEPLEWTLWNLPPCARLSLGLQTVCVSGAETRYSPMLLHQGNSAQSNILNLVQSSSGPEHYSVAWEVGTHSSVSKFRVFHDGEEQGTTLLPSFSVSGLRPCQSHTATVQALCGEGTVMDAQALQVHTVPHGVSDLRFVPDESTAVWNPGSKGSDVSFVYKLTRDSDLEVLWSGTVSEPRVPLSGLQRAHSYRLSVWEECEAMGQSERTTVEFTPEYDEAMGRAARPSANMSEDDVEHLNDLLLIVPWSLPEELQDQTSDPWVQMATILQDRMEVLLSDYDTPLHIELMTSGAAEEPGHTQYLLAVFEKLVNRTTGEAAPGKPLSISHELEDIWSLRNANCSIVDGVINWEGPDLCRPSPCPQNSLCLNTLGAFSCLCRQDHYNVRAFMKKPAASKSPLCHDKGLFSRCLDKQLVGGISKLYLMSHLQGALLVSLNQGQCPVNESADFYYFKTPRNSTHCGTKKWVNETHIELQNTLTVTGAGGSVRRRQTKVVLKCVYPRRYLRSALVGQDLDWVSSVSVVAYNSSLQLGLSMDLFRDQSFSYSFSDAVMLGPDDTLFFQVSLQNAHAFVQDVWLQVVSCWATETPDPLDQVQGIILQDGCPADETFSWLSENGASQSSRFSVQMFQMPLGLPLYFHCRAAICGPHDNCTMNCSGEQRRRRSVFSEGRAAVVSAGPLVVTRRQTSRGKPSHYEEHMTVIIAVAGTIGFLSVTLLFVSAAKAVMSYYERLEHQ